MLYISRWWPEGKKINGVGVRKVRFYTLIIVLYIKCLFLNLFVLTCLWHMHSRYICNNVFPWDQRIQKIWSSRDKVKFFTLDNCSVGDILNLFLWTCLLHSAHVTYVTMYFLCSIVWDTSCYMFQDGDQRMQKMEYE